MKIKIILNSFDKIDFFNSKFKKTYCKEISNWLENVEVKVELGDVDNILIERQVQFICGYFPFEGIKEKEGLDENLWNEIATLLSNIEDENIVDTL